MDETQVRQHVAMATSQLAAKFERFLDANQALLTPETETQLRQVIGDLHNTADLLGVDVGPETAVGAGFLSDALESYAIEMTDEEEYLRRVAEIAASAFAAAHGR